MAEQRPVRKASGATQALDGLLSSLQDEGRLLVDPPPGGIVRGWLLYVEVVDPEGYEWGDWLAPQGQPASMTLGMAHLADRLCYSNIVPLGPQSD